MYKFIKKNKPASKKPKYLKLILIRLFKVKLIKFIVNKTIS